MRKFKIIIIAVIVLGFTFNPFKIDATVLENENQVTEVNTSEEVVEQPKVSSRLASNEIIVYDFASFKTAVEGLNGITTIYLGANILQTSGVVVNPAKANIIIDGTNPDTLQRFSLEDRNSLYVTDTIYLASTPTLPATIILRNVDLIGHNYYGVVAIYDGVNNVVIEFNNILYNGPELTYNRGGTIRIIDSEINVDGPSEQELAEVNQIVIGGRTILNHTNGYNMFAFNGTNTSTTFLKDSVVDVYVMYSFGSLMNNYTQEENSIVNIYQSAGQVILTGNGNFTINKDAQLNIEQTAVGALSANFISWTTTTSTFNILGGSLNIINDGTRSANYLNIVGKINMNAGKISVLSLNDTAYPVVALTNTLSMVDSEISIKFNANYTSVNPILSNTNTNTLTNSKINVDVATNVQTRVINFSNTTSLNKSNININVLGRMVSPGSTPLLNFTTLTFTESNININVVGLSGILVSYTGSLSVDSNSKIILSSGSANESLLVGPNLYISNGGYVYIHLGVNTGTSGYLLRLVSDLSVYSSGSLFLNSENTTNSLVNFTGSSAAIQFDNAKQVIMYAPKATNRLVNTTYTASVYINTQQINQFATASTFTGTGTLDYLPTKIMRKKDNTNYDIVATLQTGTTGDIVLDFSNYDSGDGLDPATDLSFRSLNSKAFAVGYLNYSVNQVSANSTSVTGTSDPNAKVRINYTSKGVAKVANGTVNNDGTFNQVIEAIDQVNYTIKFNVPYLYETKVNSVSIPVGTLKFTHTDALLDYQTSVIPTHTSIIKRVNPSWYLQVEDSRGANANWKLSVAVNKQLTPSDLSKPVLNDSFIFVNESGQKTTLSGTPQVIKAVNNGSVLTNVSWSDSQGVLLEVNPSKLYSNVEYHGQLQWILQDTP